MALSEDLRQRIADMVASNSVVLFMKGTRRAPQCGFSAQVVEILQELSPDYRDVDVLSSPELREGIKEYSQWPTIPQLFVRGQFVGGCDIVRDMNASGELSKLLGVQAAPVPAPRVSVTAGARAAFEQALSEANGEVLHLKVDAAFEYDLFLAPRQPGDIEAVSEGFTVLVDASSARRADGIHIDFISGQGGGFKIENPNEPPKVRQVNAPELRAMMKRGEVVLFDVRPEVERALASIPEARPLDAGGQEFLYGLPRDTAIALHCHHGVRSQNAAERLLAEGFTKVYNLKGGIEAWSQTVDPAVPRY
jgi:monothiol glutaredoxin